MARRPKKVAATGGHGVGLPAAPALVLAAALDLAAAAPLHAELLGRRGSDLAVDASAVRHLGGLCAQVLASAAATWAADGRSIGFQTPSEAFAKGAGLLGLAGVLEIGA